MRSLILSLRSVFYLIVFVVVLLHILHKTDGQRLQPPRQYFQTHQETDDEPVPQVSDDDDDIADNNSTEPGMHLGSSCQFTCSPKLLHVYCDPNTGHCECDKKYPVKLTPSTGCEKPKKLGEQCLYRESCIFTDPHSSCIQLNHNAICQCLSGYHSVSLQKPSKRVFCAEDLELLTSDFSALAGVVTGIAVLGGLICFVLRLFTQARSPRPRHFANANLAPPILFSSDTGIPLTVHSSVGRSTSRASSQRTFVSSYSRRPSSAQGCLQGSQGQSYGSRGVLVSASRAGSRRPSLASVHSSGSSVKSYSTRRFEREREEKEERHMQIKLAKMQQSMQSNKPPTPSPQSTDELLPSVHRQVPYNEEVPLAIEEECASTSFQNDLLGPGTSKEFR